MHNPGSISRLIRDLAGLAPAHAAVLLAGCAHNLGGPVAAPALPGAYAAAAAQGVAPAGPSLEQWWLFFDDPQLRQLVEQALRSAPDSRTAEARLAEAVAIRQGALAGYGPQGGLDGAAVRTSVESLSGSGADALQRTYRAGFDVSWELDVFGRKGVARAVADADLEAARFDYGAARASLAANVADQLFQARGLAIALADVEEAARIQRELLRIAKGRAETGLGMPADVLQSASEAAQAEAQIADITAQLHAARRTLLALLGRGGEPVEALEIVAKAAAPPRVPASVPGELLARRPDVRRAAAQVLAEQGVRELDELALFPTFTLLPGVGLQRGPLLGTTASWSLGAGLLQPILDIPRLKSQIRAQGARVDLTAGLYERTVQTAFAEADNALVQLAADEDRVRMLLQAEADARAAYESALRRYQGGLKTYADVLAAERTWRGARRELTSAQVQALRRSVQAFKALGGGWTVRNDRAA